MLIEHHLSKETTRLSYEATAKEYASNVAALAPTASIEKFVKFLPPQAKIIDLGCGSGRDAVLFNNLGVDVLGIDFCANLLEIAKAHAPSAEFRLMDIENIDLPLASFDGAWAACSLGHIAKTALPTVLQTIHSLLKDNGYFYLALKKGNGESLEKDSRYEGNFLKFWSYYSEEELKQILQLAQFKIVDFATVEINHSYQSHPAFRIFCQKI